MKNLENMPLASNSETCIFKLFVLARFFFKFFDSLMLPYALAKYGFS